MSNDISIYTRFSESVSFRMRMDKPQEIMKLTWALGLVGETGEVVDLIKKHIGHSHPLDRVKLVKELGDVEWYMEALRQAYRIVRQANVFSIQIRHKDTEIGSCREVLYFGAEVGLIAEAVADMDFNSECNLGELLYSADCNLAAIYKRFNITREEALEANIAKLAERYPNGFNTEDSLKRRDVGANT